MSGRQGTAETGDGSETGDSNDKTGEITCMIA